MITEEMGTMNIRGLFDFNYAENPVPIIVPCHRVIGKNGKLVGFKDGVEFKDFLLTHELFAAMPLA